VTTNTLVDLVKIYATNTGTGPFALGPAYPAFRGVEALTDGAQYGYSVRQGANYEVGSGVWDAGAGTLTRTVEWSSAGNAPIALGPNAVINFPALAVDFQTPGPIGPAGPAGPVGPAADLSGLLEKANNLGDLPDVPTARGNLGLGSAALLSNADVDERARDAVGAALAGGTGVTIVVNDAGDTITIDATGDPEVIRDTIGAALVAGAGITITVDDAGDIITIKVTSYIFSVAIIAVATAAEVVGLHVAGKAFTIPANFGSGALLSYVGTNPTATYAIDVQQNGTTIGTISVSTSGVVTATTTSGAAKSIAAADVLKFVAPGTADATGANMAFTIIGAR
jgi:hypothetical protein